MKIKALAVSLVLVTVLLAGCGSNATKDAKTEGTTKTTQTDAVTTASIVNDEASFLKAISKDGTWIIATLGDMTIDKDLVLDGPFTNKDLPARKIALYTQDDKHNVTARFTLKAPKLTVTSENARIQGGTFVGDVYVDAKGFSVVDAKVEGNVYFANDEDKATFKLDKGGTVSGATEVKK